MNLTPEFAAELKAALKARGLLDQLPWILDPEANTTFWAAVDGLSVEQAVRVAEAVRAGIEWGTIRARNNPV